MFVQTWRWQPRKIKRKRKQIKRYFWKYFGCYCSHPYAWAHHLSYIFQTVNPNIWMITATHSHNLFPRNANYYFSTKPLRNLFLRLRFFLPTLRFAISLSSNTERVTLCFEKIHQIQFIFSFTISCLLVSTIFRMCFVFRSEKKRKVTEKIKIYI